MIPSLIFGQLNDFFGYPEGFIPLLIGLLLIIGISLFMTKLEMNGRMFVLILFAVTVFNVLYLQWPWGMLLLMGGFVAIVMVGGFISE